MAIRERAVDLGPQDVELERLKSGIVYARSIRVGGNKKGVFTRDRRPKLGVHFLRQRWAEIPTFGFKE